MTRVSPGGNPRACAPCEQPCPERPGAPEKSARKAPKATPRASCLIWGAMRTEIPDEELIDLVAAEERPWLLRTLAELMASFLEEGVPEPEVHMAVERVCWRLGVDIDDIRRAAN